MKGVRKCKRDIVLDESRLLMPSGVRGGLKFPGGFEGFKQWCGGGRDGLMREALIHKAGYATRTKTHFYRTARGTDDLAHVALSKGQEANG